MGVDDESEAVPEQSQTQGEGERETREGEGCLSAPGGGHNTDKFHHHRTLHPSCPGNAKHLSSDGGSPQL